MNGENGMKNNGENGGKITSFTSLNAWKEAHAMVLEIYKLTKLFPKDEQFSLVDQLRRAAISITSNIAEGFSRQSFKEKVQFYSIAKGSNTEVQSQLLVARDLSYITKQDFNNVAKLSINISKLLTGLIRSSKQKI